MDCRLIRLGRIGYARALELQRALADSVAEGADPALVLCEHDPVYTLGRRSSRDEFLDLERARACAEIVETDRGGRITYHGPGQLVSYPILPLARLRKDIGWYLRALEGACIEALGSCGVEAGRREGLTGVWVGTRKLASIGIRVRRWVTMHGMAVNVSCDLAPFGCIVPCGIRGCEQTTVSIEAGKEVSAGEFGETLARALARAFGLELHRAPARDLIGEPAGRR